MSCRDELLRRYEEACQTAAVLDTTLQKAKLEVLSLQCSLTSNNIEEHGTLIPRVWRSGKSPGDSKNVEFKELIRWLAEKVDLSQEVVFIVGSEIMVGKYRVGLGRMASWRLTGVGMKLSVPYELRADIMRVLATTRRCGHVNDMEVQEFTDRWTMVAAEALATSKSGVPVPAFFLVHKDTARTLIVADWPAVEAEPPKKRPLVNPTKYFSQPLTGETPHSIVWPMAPTATPSGARRGACSSTAEAPSAPVQVSEGDRVEVQYDGRWLLGVVQRVEGNVVNVQCDDDRPGLLTIVPLLSVRLAPSMESPCADTINNMIDI